MVLIDQRKETIPFNSIEQGNIFTDGDGTFAMKIEPIFIANIGFFNAVDLENGNAYRFKDTCEVVPIKRANIIIYD